MPENTVFKIFAFHDFLRTQELSSEGTARFSRMFRDAYKLLVSNLGLSRCTGYSLNESVSDVRSLKFFAKKLKKHFFWGCKVELRYLLLKQLAYDCSLFGYNLSEDDKRFILKELFMEKENTITEMTFSQLLSQVEKWDDDQGCASQWNAFVENEKQYNELSSFEIAVCATMSAGKSTFVNALLGCDVLPSMNEATTAKIASVYDKDGLERVVGYRQTKMGKEFSCNLDGKTLKDWNSSSETKRIYLQGDLDGIKNTSKYAVAVHDTPGTNNSQNQTHHDMTMEFLEKEKLDALIYVANYEQLLTTDEEDLLKEIRVKIKDRGIPVLFVVNKVDSYDMSKENFADAINSLDEMVRNMGYDNFSIVPVAARPARLFKMALSGKVDDFTEAESDMLDILINKFTKRMDVNSMAVSPVAKNSADIYGKNQGDCVIIDEKKYSVVTLREALVNTGLLGIEAAIENMLR